MPIQALRDGLRQGFRLGCAKIGGSKKPARARSTGNSGNSRHQKWLKPSIHAGFRPIGCIFQLREQNGNSGNTREREREEERSQLLLFSLVIRGLAIELSLLSVLPVADRRHGASPGELGSPLRAREGGVDVQGRLSGNRPRPLFSARAGSRVGGALVGTRAAHSPRAPPAGLAGQRAPAQPGARLTAPASARGWKRPAKQSPAGTAAGRRAASAGVCTTDAAKHATMPMHGAGRPLIPGGSWRPAWWRGATCSGAQRGTHGKQQTRPGGR
jgi:hypothetical protein